MSADQRTHCPFCYMDAQKKMKEEKDNAFKTAKSPEEFEEALALLNTKYADELQESLTYSVRTDWDILCPGEQDNENLKVKVKSSCSSCGRNWNIEATGYPTGGPLLDKLIKEGKNNG